ncbi:MAG: hypothetical protein P4L81_00870 [Candidatus Pacebacteria bacterium]|nr:hypothetical protein [Candidatus Paceibacterota bacterium]
MLWNDILITVVIVIAGIGLGYISSSAFSAFAILIFGALGIFFLQLGEGANAVLDPGIATLASHVFIDLAGGVVLGMFLQKPWRH